jgi:hypothetical protein
MDSVGDVDPAAARTTRRLLTELAGTDDLLLGPHFTHPTGGRVQQHGSRFELVADAPAFLTTGSISDRQQDPAKAS